jgi:hypothetical protein
VALPSIRELYKQKLTNENITEVMIAGRWIRIEKGSYRDDSAFADGGVSFKSDDGTRIYRTSREHVQLKVGTYPNE